MQSRGESGEPSSHLSADGLRSILSVRQWHVAELAAHGYSNREIASELGLTEQIVKNVLHSVFDRVGVWNRVELANRFPKGIERRAATQRQDQIEPKHLKHLLECETVSRKTEAGCGQPTEVADTGMELRDLLADTEFPRRKPKRRQTYATEAYRSLARVFADDPDVILQRLVDAATSFCDADSAGVSLEEGERKGEKKFRWIAISGSFAPFLGGTTPRFFSPCGIALSSGRAQLYRVTSAYYDYLGIKAEPITDGILIPWQTGEMRGTVWVVSHRHREAFDLEDFKLIDGLADFAAIAVENHFHQGNSQMREKLPDPHVNRRLVDVKAG